MSRHALTDEPWPVIEPWIPGRRRGPGRPRADERTTWDGMLYVLPTGCAWEDLPRDYGAAVTCGRRVPRWSEDGPWERVWRALLGGREAQRQLAWSRACRDGRGVPATKGAAVSASPSAARARKSWWWPTVRGCRSGGLWRGPARPNTPWRCRPWRRATSLSGGVAHAPGLRSGSRTTPLTARSSAHRGGGEASRPPCRRWHAGGSVPTADGPFAPAPVPAPVGRGSGAWHGWTRVGGWWCAMNAMSSMTRPCA